MLWFKRNLIFAVSLIVITGVFLYGCYYLYTKVEENNTAQEQLTQTSEKLKKIFESQAVFPSPTNIAVLKNQEVELRGFLADAAKAKVGVEFDAKLSPANFKTLLDNSLVEMTQAAEKARVSVQQRDFSFSTIKPLVNFAEGSVPLLAEQLADIRAIVNVLLRSEISSIDVLRREPVSKDDVSGLGGSDYHGYTRRTNELTGDVSSFYAVTFRGFTESLSTTINNLQKSPYGFSVKLISVHPDRTDRSANSGVGAPPPPPGARNPFGAGPGQPIGPVPGAGPGPGRPGVPPPPGGVRPGPGGAPAPARRLDVVVDERAFKVAMLIEVTKPAPAVAETPAKP